MRGKKTRQRIVVESKAKINLTLDIGKKAGQYHLVETILHEIPLKDRLVFERSGGEGIQVACSHPDVPSGRNNLVYKAVEALQKTAGKEAVKKISGIKITIQKKIPVAAGLGGGSGNAAAALTTLNAWLKLKVTEKKIIKIAESLGVDVPFFIRGGTAYGSHFGEKIRSLLPAKLPPVIIVLNTKKQSTAALYKGIDALRQNRKTERCDGSKKLMRVILAGDKIEPGCMANNFDAVYENGESASAKAVRKLKKKLLHSGARGVHICGSGPALYAIYNTKAQRDTAYRNLKKEKLMFLCKMK